MPQPIPQLAILADDFSGAAELAAVAARRGLSAEVRRHCDRPGAVEVVAYDTNTRAASGTEVTRIVGEWTRRLREFGITRFYKKTDSVLRGNIAAEIESMLEQTEMSAPRISRALLVPANPSKGRIIRGGKYFIDGVPLNETLFARDPRHPRWTADVAALLGSAGKFPIEIPDAVSAEDLRAAVRRVDAVTLPAGGVDFFESLLEHWNLPSRPCVFVAPRGRMLFVCGSAAAWESGRARECAEIGRPIVVLPEELYRGNSDPVVRAAFGAEIEAAFVRHGTAMAAIGRPVSVPTSATPEHLCGELVAGVFSAFERSPLDWLCVEGGATAAALFARCGWHAFDVLPGDLVGVAALRAHAAGAPRVLVKPGSYPWSGAVWRPAPH